MKRLSLFVSIFLALTLPAYSIELSPPNGENAYQFQFNGTWLPNIPALHVGPKNYTTLQNLRYTDTDLKTCEGYSKITTNAMSPTPLSGYHFIKENGASYFLTKATTGGNYYIYENTAVVPAGGDYTAAAITGNYYETFSLGSGSGTFSSGPAGMTLYGDSTGAYTYGAEYVRPTLVLASNDGSVPLADIFDYTVEANNTEDSFTYNQAVTQYLYVGSPYRINGYYITVSSANVSASTLTLAAWTGSTWTTQTKTDETTSGGVALAQSGRVYLTAAATSPQPLYLNGDVLYWYRFTLSAGSAGISNITLDVPFQRVTDFWNKSGRTCIGFHVYRNSEYEDYTYQVAERSTKDAPFAATIGGVDGSDYIYLMFEEPVMGFDIRMLEGLTNRNTAKISAIAYWDGDSYANVTGIVDRTLDSGATVGFNKSGVVSWAPQSSDNPQPKNEFGVVGYSYRITVSAAVTDAQKSVTNATLTFAAATDTITENDPTHLWPDVGTPFEVNDVIHVSGTDDNDGVYTISAVSTHIITAYDGITDEASGDTVTIVSYDQLEHDGTSIDTVTGITAPIDMTGYESVGFYSGRVMLIDGNRVDYSLPDTPYVYNGVNTSNDGELSLHFGDDSGITSTHSLFNRYGSNIIESWVVTKKSETYMLTGSQPYFDYNEPFVIRTISRNLGCPAPMTMKAVEIGFEVGSEVKRNALIWIDSSGPVIFDGAVISPIPGVENFFDPTKTEYIKQSLISLATAYYDSTHMEYNLIFPSGSSATANNKWVVYDLKRRKWYEKVPHATPGYPIYTTGVKDAYGTKYNYGQLSNKHLMRMDNSQTWDSYGIAQYVKTGEFSPPVMDEFGLWSYSGLKAVKIISMPTTEDVDITTTIYADSSASSQTQTIALNSGTNLSMNSLSDNHLGINGYTYQIQWSTTTSTNKWEPLAWGYKSSWIGEE